MPHKKILLGVLAGAIAVALGNILFVKYTAAMATAATTTTTS